MSRPFRINTDEIKGQELQLQCIHCSNKNNYCKTIQKTLKILKIPLTPLIYSKLPRRQHKQDKPLHGLLKISLSSTKSKKEQTNRPILIVFQTMKMMS